MHPIDLRSDTVTHPTPEMRRAMADAEVGDDVFGEDPAVNRLQAMAAERTGKEAALFVASGTMANLIAVMCQAGRGDEILIGDQSHIFLDEAGGAAALGGVHSRTLRNQPDGTLLLADIESGVRDSSDIHCPASRLLCLENTQNMCGGMVLPMAYLSAATDLARRHSLGAHLDGARLFNAAAALGVPASEIAAPFDTVMFCLSKGLCAPVGSMLCGPTALIDRARRLRKQLGGGMRQVGVLAAAGMVALEQMTARLGDDHAKARGLADGLRGLAGVRMQPDPPPTNMVFFELAAGFPMDASAFIGRLAQEGVLALAAGPRRIRLVTHYWIGDDVVRRAAEAVRRVAGG